MNRLLVSAAHKSSGKTTVSIGLAVLRDGDDPEKLLAREDKALYRAKREGRNRVCVAPAYVE